MGYFASEPYNKTNGAISVYKFSAINPSPILNGDQFFIKLPKEVTVVGNVVICTMLAPSYILAN
jgi:hypothetical protein